MVMGNNKCSFNNKNNNKIAKIVIYNKLILIIITTEVWDLVEIVIKIGNILYLIN